jgi:hypothetical protein
MKMRAICTAAAVSGVLTLGMPGAAAGEDANRCTVYGGPPGQTIAGFAQTVGHSAAVNPGNAQNTAPPFVPAQGGDCNPTDNPAPPNPQL